MSVLCSSVVLLFIQFSRPVYFFLPPEHTWFLFPPTFFFCLLSSFSFLFYLFFFGPCSRQTFWLLGMDIFFNFTSSAHSVPCLLALISCLSFQFHISSFFICLLCLQFVCFLCIGRFVPYIFFLHIFPRLLFHVSCSIYCHRQFVSLLFSFFVSFLLTCHLCQFVSFLLSFFGSGYFFVGSYGLPAFRFNSSVSGFFPFPVFFYFMVWQFVFFLSCYLFGFLLFPSFLSLYNFNLLSLLYTLTSLLRLLLFPGRHFIFQTCLFAFVTVGAAIHFLIHFAQIPLTLFFQILASIYYCVILTWISF